MLTDRFAGPVVNELRARAGLTPIRGIFDDWIHSPLLTVGMWPEWYAPPQPDHPKQIKLTSFPLYDAAEAQPVPDDVESFLTSGYPPIVFTPGSANVHARSFFEIGVEACRQINRRALLLSKYPEHVPPNLPGFAHHSPFAPLTRLLPRCAALVHHGGIGTTAAGLAAGIPQIVWPLSHDQPDNAARIKKLAAGDRILPKHFKPEHVAHVLNTLLNSQQIKQNCTEYAARLAKRNGIAEACDLIEALPASKTASIPASV
jgi:UDP:flavonoid glycosyltransferase YjiC (YdhE family)